MASRALLLICDFNAHGGTQTQVLELLAGIDSGRYRPLLCTLTLGESLSSRVGALGVPVKDLALHGALAPHTLAALSGLGKFIRENDVSVIHGFLLQGNLVAAAVGRRSGVPYLTSVRNLELWKRPHEVLASRWAHRGARMVTFNSKHVRDLVAVRESIPSGRTRIIRNGLTAAPPASTAGWPSSRGPRLVCAASLFPKKGHACLLGAFARVRRDHPEAVLLLAGQGPERENLQALARTLEIHGSVVFAGYRPDARALVAAADLIVLASIEEGTPNVLLEAMAAGVPQVATNAGGTPEVVDEGVTGFLVPPRDPALMAERIHRLLSDPGLRSKMAAASRERFERLFAAERMVREHEALYDEVLGGAA
jgi:L-malate glycosyltransferase